MENKSRIEKGEGRILKGKFGCEKCEGNGEYPVANGPDDFDMVECSCSEQYQEDKVNAYRAYLEALDDENFGYEYNDRMGCDPEWDDTKGDQFSALLDHYGCCLFQDATIDWINNTRYLESQKNKPAEPKDPDADPDCPYCKGKGWNLVRIDEDDVDKDPCDCVINPKYKRFRISIYADVHAHTEEQAKIIAEKLAEFINNPHENEQPGNYYNPYVGGAARLIDGDLLGNAKRLDKI